MITSRFAHKECIYLARKKTVWHVKIGPLGSNSSENDAFASGKKLWENACCKDQRPRSPIESPGSAWSGPLTSKDLGGQFHGTTPPYPAAREAANLSRGRHGPCVIVPLSRSKSVQMNSDKGTAYGQRLPCDANTARGSNARDRVEPASVQPDNSC